MRAAVIHRTGPPDVLVTEDVDDPVAGSGELLVRVEAVSIEGGDTLSRRGGDIAVFPHIVGYQAAGIVEAVGPGVDVFSVGDRVVTVGLDGSHAELRVAHQLASWWIPQGLSTVEAACVPIAFATADDALFEFGRLQPGECVLVHAAAGGVGVAAIQLAHRAGARVLGTASSDARLSRLAPLGLDAGINYRTTDFVAESRRLTAGRGVDVVVDTVGGETLRASLAALAYRGRCVSVGDAGRGPADLVDASALRASNQSLTGYFMGAELFASRRAHDLVSRLLLDVAEGRLSVVIDRTFPLAEAAAAHAYVESRAAVGRVVLVP